MARDDVKERRVALKARGVEGDALQEMRDAGKSAGGVFEGDAADEAVDFVAEGE